MSEESSAGRRVAVICNNLTTWALGIAAIPIATNRVFKIKNVEIFIIDVEPFLNYIYCTSSGNLRYFIANVGILRRQISANHSSLNILLKLKFFTNVESVNFPPFPHFFSSLIVIHSIVN